MAVFRLGKDVLKIAVLGAGRMGAQIVRVIDDQADVSLSALWSRSTGTVEGRSVETHLDAALSGADVAIDFTLPGAAAEIFAAVRAAGVPLVSGVSGLDAGQMRAMHGLAGGLPVLHDRNMSYGIAVLNALLSQASGAFAEGFTTEIHETHHVHKLDAPSGTALMLGETIAAARGRSFDELRHYRPDDTDAEVPAGAIRFVVRREGEVPGDHRVEFRSPVEKVSLEHSVSDRRVFAEGAVRAARWLAGQPPGFYQMADVLLR